MQIFRRKLLNELALRLVKVNLDELSLSLKSVWMKAARWEQKSCQTLCPATLPCEGVCELSAVVLLSLFVFDKIVWKTFLF